MLEGDVSPPASESPPSSFILIVINVYQDVPMQDGISNEGRKSSLSTVWSLID